MQEEDTFQDDDDNTFHADDDDTFEPESTVDSGEKENLILDDKNQDG